MLADKIRELRRMMGFSQKQLGEKLGVGQSTVAMWENGKNSPPYAMLLLLSEVFGISIAALTGEEGSLRVPVLGRVQAGIPREAVEDIIGYEELAPGSHGEGEFFALKIRGRSMEPRFVEGDTVIVRRQSSVDNGDIAIVFVDGAEATCKKFYRHNDGISLVSINTEFAPMFFSAEELENTKIEILGKVCELRARF